ncbi:MAG: dinitrogenase iron-molybdenum cofactor biosynthesis protein [Adlercreutzia sp.]|nr:dinitrogenase iron-molybdenum cofactor biosynthesis protein [Adlercreutzia sp.]
MRIAVACDGLEIAPHAATCTSFACYAIEAGVICGCSNVPNMALTAKERANTLKQMDVTTLLAQTFSPEGLTALAECGIEAVPTTDASPRDAVNAFLHATLMGDDGLTVESLDAEPLDDIDDAFAKIEYKLVAQSA